MIIKVEVILREEPDKVVLEVSDNGKGITEKEVSDSKSFGLMGIRERVHALGGIVKISGTHNKGTTVSIQIPTDGKEPASDKDSRSR